MRKRARTDGNQQAIVTALRAVGCSVLSLASLGNGVPDLLVCDPGGVLLLCEVKTPKGKSTPDQRRFAVQWKTPIRTIRNVDEALEAVGVGR